MSLEQQVASACQRAHACLGELAQASAQKKRALLEAIAARLLEQKQFLLEANERDLSLGRQKGLSAALLDRLRLDESRIEQMAKGVEEIAQADDPIGQVLEEFTGADALLIKKVRVPIGLIAVIYESRPNVTVDAAALALKSGNAIVLKGGSEALHSNQALAQCLQEALLAEGFTPSCVEFLPIVDRQVVPILCAQSETLNLVIPRGGKGLVRAVAQSAQVPVLKHLDGICHIYVAASAQLEQAVDIVLNAKVQRPGVCNALETLLVDDKVAAQFLPVVGKALVRAGVELRADARASSLLADVAHSAASAEDWSTEYLDLILSVAVVDGSQAATEHINRYGSGHSDAILTQEQAEAEQFMAAVDSAAVYWNASTRYTDGGCFGFGAEMGISTDKIHARGPVGLRELTSYKYTIYGQGQQRS